MFKVFDPMEEKLVSDLYARNKLVHRILIDNTERIPGHETRVQLIEEICKLRSIIRQADKSVRKIVNILGKITDGFDSNGYLEKVKKTIS